MNSTLQASDFTFIQGRDLDQIILKGTSNFEIFYYHNGAPFEKMVSFPGAGESLVCSVPRVPRQTLTIEGRHRGVVGKEDSSIC